MHRLGLRQGLVCAATGLGTVLVAASGAFACASLAAIEINPSVVRPGQEVAWKGTFFARDEPVQVRWNALDGPVLATGVPPSADNGLHGNWRFVEGKLTIPADARPGTYVVVATQNAVRGTNTWGIPARTIVNVSDGTPALGQTVGPPVIERPANLLVEDSVSTGTLVVVGFGAAGAAMLLAGLAILAGVLRNPAPAAQKVRS